MVEGVFVALQVILGVLAIVLVLAHSGKDTGLSGAFGIGQGQFGATQVMERNLTRYTIICGVAWFVTSFLLVWRIG